MGGQISRYTLNLIIDESSVIPLAKGTLEQLDEVTTNFKNKQELLNAICTTFNIDTEGKSARINITYNQNKKVRYMRVLYANNIGALNRDAVGEKVLMYSLNKNFVLQFVKRYCNSPYLSTIASEIIGAINNDEDYVDPLQRIIDLTFASYKSIRDIYLFVKDYESLGRDEVIDNKIPQLDSKKDLLTALKTLKVIYDYQQLNFFGLIGDEQTNVKDNGTPKIKKRK